MVKKIIRKAVNDSFKCVVTLLKDTVHFCDRKLDIFCTEWHYPFHAYCNSMHPVLPQKLLPDASEAKRIRIY